MYTTEHLPGGEPDGLSRSACLVPVEGTNAASACGSFANPPVVVPKRTSVTGPTRGTFLKETIVLRSPAGASLVAAVIDEFSRYRNWRRKRHVSEIENDQHLLSCILANGLRCKWLRIVPLVSFQTKADIDFYTRPNRPMWLSAQAVRRNIEGLANVGLARLQVGHRGVSSSYEVSAELLQLAEACGVSERSLGTSIQREELIRLKGCKPKPAFDRFKGKLIRHNAERIYFEPTAQTEQLGDELAAYNDFVAAQDISIDLSDDAVSRWLAKLNNDDLHTGAKLRSPELFRDAVYRVFNDADPAEPKFDKGGRLAGAWWLNAPEDVRALIRIDGKPTVELDYGACHPRMLYHELDLEPPADPYDIPEIAALERDDDVEVGAYKRLVKWETQVLINGGSRPDLVTRPIDIKAPGKAALKGLRAAIRHWHDPIASDFGSRAGLRLMKVEADIAVAIISTARQNRWLALSIHDAFRVQESRVEELRTMMVEEYKIRFGYLPTINTVKGQKMA